MAVQGSTPGGVFALEVSADGSAVSDALGTAHPPAGAEARIASLVPSITELLCDLGLAESMVARTGFCVHPKRTVKRIPKVGGTKDVDVERLRALRPTHVVMNIDENRKGLYDELATFVDNIFVTHPLSPRDNIALYHALGALFCRHRAAERLTAAFEQRLSALGDAASRPRESVLYLIWKNPWMAVGTQTYIAEMLKLINWHTQPVATQARYPEVDIGEFVGKVDRVLLSSEPYAFREKHITELEQAFGTGTAVALINGEMCSWYGSRAIAGLDYLRSIALEA